MNHRNVKALLGTELAIIQAPMAGVQDSKLAIAVAKAGGLGSIACGMLNAAQITSEIQAFKAASSAPLNLNFFCHQMPKWDDGAQQVWHKQLLHYFQELEITAELAPVGASRLPFNHEIADAIEPFKPEFISFHFGLPAKDLLDRVRSWGTKLVSSATTVAEAIWLSERGVDGIIAQGLEAGGHRGMFLSSDLNTQLGLAALVPQIVDRVSVPVIAAGGIGDARGVQAAFALGASAVQVGSAYLLCDEANTSRLHREAILGATPEETALTNLFSGRPARGLRNRAMNELGCLSELAPTFPYATPLMAQLRREAEARGKADFTPLWCGQNLGACRRISAQALTLALMKP